jgi:asparagine synthase (glutamine-hydrolysing)
VLLDESVQPPRIIAARDPIGVTTLYQGWSSSRPEIVFFASELKCLVDECDKIISFPPGHVFDSHNSSLTRYYTPSWWDGDSDSPDAPIPSQAADLKSIRETLEASVKKRLMSEVPYGVLLSGGLDSSIIAAVAARETEKVAQAQFEARQRRFAQGESGLVTPPDQYSGVPEEGEAIRFSFSPYQSLKHVRFFWWGSSRYCLLAAAALILDRPGEFSRSPRRTQSSSLFGHCAS